MSNSKPTSIWNSKDSSTPLPGGLNVNVSTSGLPTLQVTACDSPASISPIRSSADSGKAVTNGHMNNSGVYSSLHSHYQQTTSAGDLNDNLIDHHHNSSVFNTSGSNGIKSGDQQRISSSSSTPLSSSSSSSHPLFLFGVCRWPGCESPCDDVTTFIE